MSYVGILGKMALAPATLRSLATISGGESEFQEFLMFSLLIEARKA